MEAIERISSLLVLNALWQVPVIAAAAFFATPARVPAAVRSRVWLAALLLAAVVPLATAARILFGPAAEPVAAAATLASAAPLETDTTTYAVALPAASGYGSTALL